MHVLPVRQVVTVNFLRYLFRVKLSLKKRLISSRSEREKKTFLISKIYSKEIISIRTGNPDVCTGFYLSALSSIDSTLYDHRAKNYPASPNSLNDPLFIGKMGSNET